MPKKENKKPMKLLLKDREQLKVRYLGSFSLQPDDQSTHSESAREGKWTRIVDPGKTFFGVKFCLFFLLFNHKEREG